jgi:hypothetical protein
MTPRLPAALAAALALLLAPSLAHACACGCSVFSVGAGSILPTMNGGTAWAEFDFMDQNKNWRGTKAAPAADNSDKQIRTDFFNLGAQYMFSCGWGVMVEAPVWNRTFRTDVGGGVIDSFHAQSLGDVRINAVYSGFGKAMTTGVTFGLKLPTGDYRADGFDRDTQIGSGSTDLLLGAYHVGFLTHDERLSYFVNGQVEAPFASIGGYRPGQTLDGAVGVIYHAAGYDDAKLKVAPVLQLIGSARRHDTGPAANPGGSGYSRLMISPGIEFQTTHWRLYGDVEVPLYQDVRGNQLTAPELFKVVVSRTF